MPKGKLHAGTSGWSYRHWKDVFYPQGLKQRDWLTYFSEEFDTVEVNMTFYRLPPKKLINNWRKEVAGGFRFAIKLWRQITHRKRLKDSREHLEDFFARVNDFPIKQRAPLLVQLPPSMKRDDNRLEAFLADKRTRAKTRYWDFTLEVRDTSWLAEEVCDRLAKENIAICLADVPDCPIETPNDADFVYMRRHGRQGDYRSKYSLRQVRKDAKSIAEWLVGGRDVFVYYNNDANGHAITNARQLREEVAKLT